MGFISALICLIRRKAITLWFVFLLLSPATLLFPIWDWLATGRKEIILFFLYAWYVLCLNKGWLKPGVALLFALSLVAAVLFHELVFFYLPYFFLVPFLKSKTSDAPFSLWKTLAIISGAFLVIIPLTLWGQTINGAKLAADLIARGLAPAISKGILSWPADFGPRDMWHWAEGYGFPLLYSTTLTLSLLPFLWMAIQCQQPTLDLKTFLVILAGLFLFSAPLFVLAVDWGRWINIHCMLLLVTSTFFLRDCPKPAAPDKLDQDFAMPNLWRSRTMISKRLNHAVFWILGAAYVTLWCLPICGTLNKHTMDIYVFFYRLVRAVIQ